MKLDIQKYARFVDGFDLSDKQKRELIETVWQIMAGFADRAFGIHPIQQASGKEPDTICQRAHRSIESRGNNIKTMIERKPSLVVEDKTDS